MRASSDQSSWDEKSSMMLPPPLVAHDHIVGAHQPRERGAHGVPTSIRGDEVGGGEGPEDDLGLAKGERPHLAHPQSGEGQRLFRIELGTSVQVCVDIVVGENFFRDFRPILPNPRSPPDIHPPRAAGDHTFGPIRVLVLRRNQRGDRLHLVPSAAKLAMTVGMAVSKPTTSSIFESLESARLNPVAVMPMTTIFAFGFTLRRYSSRTVFGC